MKRYIYIGILATFFTSCTGNDPYTVGENTVGPLTKESPIRDLEKVFSKDSVVNMEGGSQFVNTGSAINVFEKGTAKQLLSITPKNTSDTSRVEHIQVYDDRYTTAAGVSLKSTFKDISTNYTIKRIDNLIGVVVVFVNESDAYFTIDKKHLPGELMFNTDVKISQVQIPEDAPIKYFMIGW